MESIRNDDYNDFYIVIEQSTPQDTGINILKEPGINDSNFVRFRACLQSFGKRNRNKRLWSKDIVQQMCNSKEVQEAIRKGAFVGEAGHPVSATGKVTMERIFQIDPLRCSHRITSLEWENDMLFGIVETLDEGVGSPGYRMMKNIQQGVQPAFSLRSVVPQRRNNDGSIDVIGPGRLISYDRVYIPSHEEAYLDVNIPVKQVVKKNDFVAAMEGYCDSMVSNSDKVKYIIDKMEPALESAFYDPSSQLLSMKTDEGRIFISPEMKYRNEVSKFMRSLR